MPEMIEGRAALIVVDMQKGGPDSGIPHMPGGDERVRRARLVVDAARVAGVPVVFFQEVHRRNMVDFGRELDGVEDIHCLEGPSRPSSPTTSGRATANITSSSAAIRVSSAPSSKSCSRVSRPTH